MASLRFTLNDGTVLEADPGAPWSVREQVAWEEHFGDTFVTVFKAVEAEVAAARAAESSGQDSPASAAFKLTWMLWFGWYRLRPKVASRFQTFVEEQLADYDFLGADDEPPGPGEDGSLDPTLASSPPEPSPAP